MERELDTEPVPDKVEDGLRADLKIVAGLLADAPAGSSCPVLLFRGRDGLVQRIALGEKLTCGRASDCELQFPRDILELSAHHFTISRQGDVYWLVDENSTNGTRIRARPIRKHELRDGDLINAGGLLFAFIRA